MSIISFVPMTPKERAQLKLVLREPVVADDAAGAGYRRVDSGRAAADEGDASGVDAAGPGGVGGASRGRFLKDITAQPRRP